MNKPIKKRKSLSKFDTHFKRNMPGYINQDQDPGGVTEPSPLRRLFNNSHLWNDGNNLPPGYTEEL